MRKPRKTYAFGDVRDLFVYACMIKDFVALSCGSYPRMKKIAAADALAHK